ncbi:DUF416 family protein [Endozoicomonas arenosclerae]|uniref:DUF416 family protein n=1 Tax=Endozoicomonas arenosclerae TaxID=1633495 RepID=UPI000ADEBB53|nr:DUF416 family protein [Endozoicomonas arenosclerae]
MNTHKQYALFLRQLEKLSGWKLTAMSAAVCERSWPNFALFAELTDFGQPDDVRHSLDMLWDNVAGYQSAKNFERLLEKLEPNIPDLEELDMFGAIPAHDCIVTMICAVNCAMEPDAGETASAMTLSLSTIGKFIKYTEAEELKGTELQQYIEQHELYGQQIEFMQEVLEMISRCKQSPDAMKQVRALAKNDGISHIGIGLE